MSREEYGRFLGYSVAILTQNLPTLLYSRNDNMAPSLSQQVLSHVGRLGQVIREHIRQPELDPALKRETALLFLTIYRWNWDPEDLNLAIDMTRNEQSDNSFPIYVRNVTPRRLCRSGWKLRRTQSFLRPFRGHWNPFMDLR